MRKDLLIGTHVSINGGLHMACARAAAIGCTTMQVFTKNSSQWEGKPLADEDVETYKTAVGKSRIEPVFAHASYLINLCAVNPAVLHRSRDAFEDELRRCERLGFTGLILHPGAHMGTGEQEGLQRVAGSLNEVHEKTSRFQTLTILETTAGQGSSLGYRFEHLRTIVESVEHQERLAVCVDTCHLFAAGYPIHTEDGWEQTIREFDMIVGLPRLVAVHVNDSRKGLGSRVDRHEHIGKGHIGLEGFRLLMNDSRFARVPKILETEKSEDMHEDVENMAVLRSLVA
jgi:deoxyribonuclease IV